MDKAKIAITIPMESRFLMRMIGPIIRNPENWLTLFLGLLSTYFFIQTFHYRPAAALFPRIVSTIVAVLCYYHLAENVWKGFKKQRQAEEEGETTSLGLPWRWSLSLILLYFLVIYLIGFVWGTGLFMVVFPVAAGYRRWPVILITALTTAIIIDLSFNRFLEIQLHEGVLFSFFE